MRSSVGDGGRRLASKAHIASQFAVPSLALSSTPQHDTRPINQADTQINRLAASVFLSRLKGLLSCRLDAIKRKLDGVYDALANGPGLVSGAVALITPAAGKSTRKAKAAVRISR
jgi:hypothetical protein